VTGDWGYDHSWPAGPWAPPQAVPRGLLRRTRRWDTLFTVLVWLAVLVGAGIMSVVLVTANAPDALVIGVVLAALPVGPVIAVFLFAQRYFIQGITMTGMKG